MVIWNLSISDVCGKPESDPYFCTRYVTLSLIATFTGLLCLGKVAKYHYNKVKCFYQLSIFYCALFECLCFVLHWIFLPFDIIENMGYWFRVIQLLIVCFVYSKLASNVLNAEEQYKKRYLPVLTVFALYYAALIPWMFTIPRFKYPHKCTEFFHPCYTISDFVLAQVTVKFIYFFLLFISTIMPLHSLKFHYRIKWFDLSNNRISPHRYF